MAIKINLNIPNSATVNTPTQRQVGSRPDGHWTWIWNGTVYQIQVIPKPGYEFVSFNGYATVQEEHWYDEKLVSKIQQPNLQFVDSEFTKQGDIYTPDLSRLGIGIGGGVLPAVSGARNTHQLNFQPDDPNWVAESWDYTIVGDVTLNVTMKRVYTHLPVYDIKTGILARNITRGNIVLRDSP